MLSEGTNHSLFSYSENPQIYCRNTCQFSAMMWRRSSKLFKAIHQTGKGKDQEHETRIAI